MTVKDALLQARAEMVLVLDAKIGGMPEWRALKAIESAIAAVDAPPAVGGVEEAPRRRERRGAAPSYVDLAIEAMKAKRAPVTSGEVFEFIRSRRDFGVDAKRARINIQTALSKGDRTRSVPWRGGRAWWYADREVPKQERPRPKPERAAIRR
jgi:hypothetical protein